MSMPDGREDFVAGVSRLESPVTIVLNDGTRPSPAEYLKDIVPFLPEEFRVLYATGTHRAPLEQERRSILGDFYHDPSGEAVNRSESGEHVHIGTTSRGTPVEIHPWLLEGSVVAVNTVEPHYFAGFTGGRKSFVPGCASLRTITANHFLACLPGAAVARLQGNPVHLDLAEAAGMVFRRTPCLMINGLSGQRKRYYGSPVESFMKAVSCSRKIYSVPVRQRYKSLTVHPGSGLEKTLYQSMKAVYLWESAVEDGGALVLSSPCSMGLGPERMDGLLRKSMEDVPVPESAVSYSLGDHGAIRLRRIRERISLSFNVGLPMKEYGFTPIPREGFPEVRNAGFTYPVVAGDNAEHL